MGLADLYAVSDGQRLGYLPEQLGEKRLADPLAERLLTRRSRPILLAPGQEKGDSPMNPRWRVIPNEKVEAEVEGCGGLKRSVIGSVNGLT